MEERSRWVYLATAPDQLTAEMWAVMLRNEGVPVMVRSGDTASFLGISAAPCRLLVLDDRVDDARRLLEDNLGHPPPS